MPPDAAGVAASKRALNDDGGVNDDGVNDDCFDDDGFNDDGFDDDGFNNVAFDDVVAAPGGSDQSRPSIRTSCRR